MDLYIFLPHAPTSTLHLFLYRFMDGVLNFVDGFLAWWCSRNSFLQTLSNMEKQFKPNEDGTKIPMDLRVFQTCKSSEPALACGRGNIPAQGFQYKLSQHKATWLAWFFRSKQFQWASNSCRQFSRILLILMWTVS